MKYVFLIQSHLAFYIYLQVKEYLKLSDSDVRFIIIRGYRNKYHPIDYLDLSEHYNNLLLHSPLKIDKAIEVIKDIDIKINQLCENEEFEFFCNSFSLSLFQFIATYHNCKNIHIVEDGTKSYFKRQDFYFMKTKPLKLKILETLKKLISTKHRTYFQRAPGLPEFPNNPSSKYYGIYEDVFPYVSNQQKVIFKKLYKDPLFPFQPFFNNAKLIIFDAVMVEQHRLMTEDEYIVFVLSSIRNTISSEKNIYYKMHPEQKKVITDKLKEFLENELKAHEISHDIPIEQIITHNENVEFYGFYSSLLFYAKRQGHFVKSFIEGTKHPKLRQFALDNFNDYFIKEIFKLT